MNARQKVVLIEQSGDNARRVEIENGETKIGRGETVDVRVASADLSRHHASIFRENERVWILDNNSTNGSFVNNLPVAASGTPLKDGDSVRLGNNTIFRVESVKGKTVAANAFSQNTSAQKTNIAVYAPLAVAFVAVAIIGLALVAVVARSTGGNAAESEFVAQAESSFDEENDLPREQTNANSRSNKKTKESDSQNNSNSQNGSNSPDANRETNAQIIESASPKPAQIALPAKTYLEMSDAEKRQFIEREAVVVAGMIGNRGGEVVPPAAVERIKSFVDGYARRLKTGKKQGNCGFGDNLDATIERASQNAEFIVPAFNSEGIAPQIGLYLAMIESEHCVCLQSRTGPLGMFQFTRATGASFGLETRAGASPANPDERCQPEKAAPAAARYMKFLAGRYGTGALSVPLAIASYNSGEGGLSTNLQTALNEETNQERSFWTLVANEGKLSAQFQKENIKYVPKFFAAAIVGENPTVFGVKKPPVSSNTK